MSTPSSDSAPAPKRKLAAFAIPVVALLVGGGAGFAASQAIATSEASPTAEEGAEAPAEGEGEKKEAEGHGEKKAEGHGEAKSEGHGGGHGEGKEGEGEAAEPVNKDGVALIELGAFTVNLRGAGGGRVARIELQLESTNAQAEAIKTATPKLRDTVITALSDYTWSELEGTDGKARLRDELLARVNGDSAPSVITHLYFTQFVVQ